MGRDRAYLLLGTTTASQPALVRLPAFMVPTAFKIKHISSHRHKSRAGSDKIQHCKVGDSNEKEFVFILLPGKEMRYRDHFSSILISRKRCISPQVVVLRASCEGPPYYPWTSQTGQYLS